MAPESAFGSTLRRLRLAAGLTQEELAEQAGLSARAVSALERGINRTPQRTTLEALLAGLGPQTDATALRKAARQPLSPMVGMTAAPEVHYAASGDLSIAYQVTGAGPPDLILVPGLVSHLEQNWQWPGSARYFDRLAGFCRLIRFDKRGTGMSDRVAGVPDPEERMDDVRAVMDAVGSARAVLMGQSEGGPMSLLFAATYPTRTLGLVLYGAFACSGSPDRTPGPVALTAEEERREAAVLRARYGSHEYADELLARFAPSMQGDERYRQYFADFLRQGASPGAFLTLVRMNRRIDVRALLPSVNVPTLILHRRGDRVASVEHARYMARRIPGAELLEVPGDDHMLGVGDSDVPIGAIERFLGQLGSAMEPERVLATVLAVAMARSVPERGATLQHFRGRELQQVSDDLLLAAFDGPGRAIRCALALLKATGGAARAAVSIGECVTAGESLAGPALNDATATAVAAQPGDLLVSSTVRDLVVDPSLRFQERRTSPAATGRVFAVTVG